MSAPTDFFTTALGRVYARALDARDARFDGVFFVGITTTKIYCRPVCPARVAYHSHRRFFAIAAAAEQAGYRPCLRCRPELAPGRATCDAISRVASAAEKRIAAGALNGHSVAALASDMGVSERHLRRALQRALGVSPVKLAQTHRLLFAKRLLADTSLPITQIAFASGYQSLRRFNASFAEQYRMPPTAVRRVPRGAIKTSLARRALPDDYLRLSLAYRAPLAWETLVSCLAGEAIEGVETVDGRRYGRTVEIAGKTGVVFAEDGSGAAGRAAAPCVNIDVSSSLVSALMPLLARLRQLLDLDAEPSVIDKHLSREGLAALVAANPGLRIPGAIDGFDIALRALLRGRARPRASGGAMHRPGASDAAARVTWALGEAIETGVPGLARLTPTAARIAEAGSARLMSLGIPRGRAEAAVDVARLVATGLLRLEPGSDVSAARRVLGDVRGAGDQIATMLVSRALRWPDAFPSEDAAVQRAARETSARALREKSLRWRPWGAYAALHLALHAESHLSSERNSECPQTRAFLAS